MSRRNAVGMQVSTFPLARDVRIRTIVRRAGASTFHVLAAAVWAFSAVAGAQPQLGNLTSLLAATPESSWVKVNLSPYSSAWVPEDLQVLPYVGASKPGSIIAAWSSFAWDSNRGDLILFGGGHANYGGNEVYRWHGTSQLWERASVPSEVQLLTGITYEAIDGALNAPVSAHTYDNQVFVKRLDRFLTFGGASFNDGGPQRILLSNGTIRSTGPFLWDPSRGDPNKVGGTTGSHVQRVAPHPEIVGGHMWQNLDIYNGRFPASVLPSSFIMGVSDATIADGVDTVYVTGRIGGGTEQDLFRLQIPDVANRSQDKWERVGIWWNGSSSQGAGALDPTRNIFVRTGGGGMYFSYWNLETAGPVNRDVAVTSIDDASGQFVMDDDYGMDFDSRRSSFVLWHGGGTVWRVTPPSPPGPTGWVVTREPPSVGAVPPSSVGTGVLGKFKYIQSLDAFMALDVHGDVWLYKPVGWLNSGTSTPPTVPANQAPSITITAPFSGVHVVTGTSVMVTATAGDSDGTVASVTLYSDGAAFATFAGTSPPYAARLAGLARGTHVLTAKATDDGGKSTVSAAVSIAVDARPTLLQNLLSRMHGHTGLPPAPPLENPAPDPAPGPTTPGVATGCANLPAIFRKWCESRCASACWYREPSARNEHAAEPVG